MDFFEELIKNGKLKISGLDENLKSYRIYIYKDREYKLKLEY